MADPRACEYPPCGRAMPPGAHAARRYCSDRCALDAKAGADKARKRAKRTGPAAPPPGPILTDREYTPDELEFGKAVERFKRDRRRPFPTWSEVLQVLLALGYRKIPPGA